MNIQAQVHPEYKVLPFSEFAVDGEDPSGFVIAERCGDDYAVPAWDERGVPDFGQRFPTANLAQYILARGF